MRFPHAAACGAAPPGKNFHDKTFLADNEGQGMIHLHGTQAVAFRVLIAGDEAIERVILARCVEMLGWTADIASNAADATDQFSARPHNVVIIDLRLGAQDSTRLLRRLRHAHADPTVIFVSGGAGRTQVAAWRLARDLGVRVAGTLARPIDPYRLHALLLSNPARPPAEQRLTMPCPGAQELDRALREGEVHTEYQPKTSLTTGEIVGVEALARWHSPTLGPVPPDRFVPVAEESDLIARLTFRVLEDAIATCRRWRQIQPGCSVAVNISPRVLADPGLLPMVEAILDRNGMPPDALIAEITESALLAHLPAATDVLTKFSLRGIRVAVDGFGTGCSSVLSLSRMPFTELKIDRSFVGVCGTDPEAGKLVRATVTLGRELGLRVVAEGIETAALSEQLRDVGCDVGQGWYFGRPMQAEAMLRWLNPATLAGPGAMRMAL
jgi:EAL domain-containing protein (putative c-di-GMP-specific phosphodiesterase class I)/ActR/RegA family two-component response regulator